MQRQTPQGIIIACDFCGDDWDQVKPMIEGHHGSVICLTCLNQSATPPTDNQTAFTCVLCLRELPAKQLGYRPPTPAAEGNALAAACQECLRQAKEAFGREGITA